MAKLSILSLKWLIVGPQRLAAYLPSSSWPQSKLHETPT
ncbi:hypothetical protein PS898_00890 [Pseudomonas fluorescens]|nr:hypothetical protein PS898_00890 [Pseudomonas fluorescens]